MADAAAQQNQGGVAAATRATLKASAAPFIPKSAHPPPPPVNSGLPPPTTQSTGRGARGQMPPAQPAVTTAPAAPPPATAPAPAAGRSLAGGPGRLCVACGKPGQIECTTCNKLKKRGLIEHSTFFCSIECQRAVWKAHNDEVHAPHGAR